MHLIPFLRPKLIEQLNCAIEHKVPYPLLKPRLLKGMAQCVAQDGILHPVEKQVLTAVAAVMDCPLPEIRFD